MSKLFISSREQVRVALGRLEAAGGLPEGDVFGGHQGEPQHEGRGHGARSPKGP